MSKAEDLALEKYPQRSVLVVPARGGGYYADSHLREGFVEGYHQAEKDNELTVDDVEKIHTFLYAIKNNKKGVFTFTRLPDEQYQEVLKRFKYYRERKEK